MVFAAAATFLQMALDVAVVAAQWIALRAFVIAIMMIVLPWVLRGALAWGFNWMVTYGRGISTMLLSYIQSATNGNVDVNIDLTGVGGYLAYQTGLLEYSSVIFTGWGLYWIVAVLAKTPRAL